MRENRDRKVHCAVRLQSVKVRIAAKNPFRQGFQGIVPQEPFEEKKHDEGIIQDALGTNFILSPSSLSVEQVRWCTNDIRITWLRRVLKSTVWRIHHRRSTEPGDSDVVGAPSYLLDG